MRASLQEQQGAAGTHAVAAKFEKLNWGPTVNALHDLGTDLWLQVRDRRLFDLGFLVGAQVKTGPSYFAKEHRSVDSTITGWWFYEPHRKHLDAWSTHAVPHLLVLHNLETDTSYWVHVTNDKVVPTGAGAKILVPSANRVDDDNFDALMAAATVTRPASQWEGSAWTGAPTLPADDRLRHALIVPRLLAPHRNAGFGTAPRPDQVVALLAQARLREVDIFAGKHPEVPSLNEATASPSWQWRFVGSLGQDLVAGNIDGLRARVDDAPGPAERAAAAVVATAALLDAGQPDAAAILLESELQRNNHFPVDHAWLTAQLARANVERGHVEQGRGQALEVQRIRTTHADDVTAAAIAAAGASTVFAASDLFSTDVSGVVRAIDTTSAWWRTQTASWGLTSSVAETFRTWSRDTSVALGHRDDGHNDLLSAMATSNWACDHGGWQRYKSLAARNDLLRSGRWTDHDTIQSSLQALLRAGDSKWLQLASRRTVDDGPALAAQQLARSIDLRECTHTTAKPSLILLAEAGDVLEADVADSTVTWLLETLTDPETFIKRTSPRYVLTNQFASTLARTIRATTPEVTGHVLRYLLNLPQQTDQSDAHAWAQVVRAAPTAAWTPDLAPIAATRAAHDHPELRYPLLARAAESDPNAHTMLLEAARNDPHAVLPYLDDLSELPPDIAQVIIETNAQTVTSIITQARHGAIPSYSGADPGQTLTVMNVWHSHQARWQEVLELLAEPLVRGQHKAPTLQTLAAAADRLPADLRNPLLAAAIAIADAPDRPGYPGMDDEDDRVAATALRIALDPHNDAHARERLLTSLAGDGVARARGAWLAARLGTDIDAGILTALTTDTDPRVRAAAAASLATLHSDTARNETSANLAKVCLTDPGTLVARTVLSAWTATPEVADANVCSSLTTHVSARVRAQARALLTP